MAFSHHACRTECDAMTEHYYRLRDYALNHAECNAINCLHYLADRASITGQFSDGDLRHFDQAFPLLLKQLELMLTSGELTPRHQHCVTLYAKGLTCEADSLGSHGYVYLAIYPTPAATA
ncbi:type IV toxin-antitoxin system YeeU family antitoxin [Escherichia coli]|nr:type IV toxin-antitoxin system YeeU family antitoxin [Escherichia coli]